MEDRCVLAVHFKNYRGLPPADVLYVKDGVMAEPADRITECSFILTLDLYDIKNQTVLVPYRQALEYLYANNFNRRDAFSYLRALYEDAKTDIYNAIIG